MPIRKPAGSTLEAGPIRAGRPIAAAPVGQARSRNATRPRRGPAPRGRKCELAQRNPMAVAPTYIAPARFTDPAAALAQVRAIYDGSIQHLRGALQGFVAGD